MRLSTTLIFSTALLLSACATHEAVNPEGSQSAAAADVIGTLWVADDIGGAGIVSGSDVTLYMDVTGRAGGKASCNTYGATYVTDGSALTFAQDFSTKMMCSPADLMTQEQAYLGMLGQVAGYKVTDGILVLTATDGKSATFHKKP